MQEISKNYHDLLFLFHEYFNNHRIDESKLSSMNFNAIYEIVKEHSLTSLLAYYLEKEKIDAETLNQFTKDKNSNIRKTILFNNERNVLLSKLEENKIYYLPLKGIILNNYYPSFGLREFADNDIYFDGNKDNIVLSIFKDNHYEVISYRKSVHDVYEKKPCFNFEMHRKLFDESHLDFYKYYSNINQIMIKDEDNQYGYHLSDNDFYIYFIAHAYKHYQSCGNGLRFLIDDYFILKNIGQNLNRDYLNQELDKLQLTEFEKDVNQLVNDLWNKDNIDLTKKEKEMLSYILNSGTYGTLKNKIVHDLDKTNHHKIKYLWRRIYPGYSTLKVLHPFIAKTYVLIPFYIIGRIIKGFIRGKNTFLEIEILNQMK